MMTTGIKDSVHQAMTPTEPLARAFLDSHLPSTELQERVKSLLSREDLPKVVEDSTIDTVQFVDKLDKVYLNVSVQERRFLDLLGNFYRATKQFPNSVLLSAGLEKSSMDPMNEEQFADNWSARYQGASVVIKVPRAHSTQSLEEVKEVLRARAPTWRKLDHLNIARFHGVTYDLSPVGLVYDWGEDDDILDYVNTHPESSRAVLLLQVAKGLRYLHLLNLTHGSLRPTNVLVSRSGHVRLTGYGLAPINANPYLTATSPSSEDVQWLAPELIDPSPGPANGIAESKPADIFAFGILGFQVSTGQPPFGDSGDLAVSRQILEGIRPVFPPDAEVAGLTNELKELLRGCWDEDPTQRRTIDEVVGLFEGLPEYYHSPQPTPPPEEPVGQLIRPDSQRETKWWWRYSCGLW